MKWGTAIIIFKVWISTLKIEISNALNIDLNRYVTIKRVNPIHFLFYMFRSAVFSGNEKYDIESRYVL